MFGKHVILLIVSFESILVFITGFPNIRRVSYDSPVTLIPAGPVNIPADLGRNPSLRQRYQIHPNRMWKIKKQ